MDLAKILTEVNLDDIVYENEYLKVLKVLHETKTGNTAKRLQLVVWKEKKTDVPDIDFRKYDYKKNIYKKGITLSLSEAKGFAKSLVEFLNEHE